jgi:hypothetical protein
LDAKKWYILIAAIVVVLVALWFWYNNFYSVLHQQEHACLSAIAALEQKKVQIPDVRYQVDVLRQHNEQTRSDLQGLVIGHQSIDPYAALERILGALDAAGLQLVSFTPQEFKHKIFYEKCTFGFQALGAYDQIMQFLDHFCEKNPCSLFKKIVINHADDQLLVDALVALYLIEKEGA